MDILAFALSAAIFVLKGLALCVPPFLALLLTGFFQEHSEESPAGIFGGLAAAFLGLYFFWLDPRTPLGAVFKDAGPWNLSFLDFWLTLANPLAYPVEVPYRQVADDARYNQLLVVGLPLLVCLLSTIKAFRTSGWRVGLLGFAVQLCIIYTAYFVCAALAWVLHYSWIVFAVLFLGLGGLGTTTRTIQVRPGESVSIRFDS